MTNELYLKIILRGQKLGGNTQKGKNIFSDWIAVSQPRKKHIFCANKEMSKKG